MLAQVSSEASYAEKFTLLDRNMRWEIADLLRERHLAAVNESESAEVELPDTFYVRHGKRILDITISASALLATLPINAAVGVITATTLGRPLLFKQQRIGLNGELFTLVKFRNMREGHDKNGHPLPGHLRVTKLGKIMRKTSLDELLNFWSVLKGDMSIIGPRPLVPEYGGRFSTRHQQRHKVRPGLECPPRDAQHGVRRHSDQFENDVWYVANVSLKTDLHLTKRLFESVFDRKQAATRAASARGAFLGYDTDGNTVSSHDVPEWALHEILKRHGMLEDDSTKPTGHHVEEAELHSADV